MASSTTRRDGAQVNPRTPPPPATYVAVLIMADGRIVESIRYDDWDVANLVGHYSLLDDEVADYRVEARVGGAEYVRS
jgi:hypothetical protein